jgi:hypothetical protein
MRLTKHKNWRRVSSLKNHHSEVTYFFSAEHITCPILKLTGVGLMMLGFREGAP